MIMAVGSLLSAIVLVFLKLGTNRPQEVTDKKVLIKYFNARGEFTKPVSSKLKDITYIHVDSPYANTFYKYAKEVA